MLQTTFKQLLGGWRLIASSKEGPSPFIIAWHPVTHRAVKATESMSEFLESQDNLTLAQAVTWAKIKIDSHRQQWQ